MSANPYLKVCNFFQGFDCSSIKRVLELGSDRLRQVGFYLLLLCLKLKLSTLVREDRVEQASGETIYLLLRVCNLLTYSLYFNYLIASIGGFTCLFGGIVAVFQSDMKKIIAYSTTSQLG